MAIRKTIESTGKAFVQTPIGAIENGVQQVSFSAYIKVVGINGDKNQVVANVHFDSELAKFHKQYEIPVSVDSGSSNFIAQAYEHLKKLPEFAGAVDC
jgi:hypothetical protein